jgi:hypothetical protein
MADQDDKPNSLLERADAGLMALNLGTLTFIAGLEKLGDIGAFINLRILIGGLCVGIFFAVLCAYFTVVGSAATRAAAKRLGARIPFDTGLSLGRQGLTSIWSVVLAVVLFAAFLVPMRIAWLDVKGERDALVKEQTYVASITHTYKERCPAARVPDTTTAELNSLKDPAKAIRLEQIERADKAATACRELLATTNDARHDSISRSEESTGELFKSIWSLLIFYLLLPFVLWAVSPGLVRTLMARLGGPAAGEVSQRQDIVARGDRLQILRLLAIMASLLAFTTGVGLAMVNTGVASLQLGLEQGAPALTAPPPSAVTLDIQGQPITTQAAGGSAFGGDTTINHGAASGPTPVFQFNPTITPAPVTTPAPPPPVNVYPSTPVTIAIPDSIHLDGIPEPKTQTVELQMKGLPGDAGAKGDPGLVWRCKRLFWKCGYEAAPAPSETKSVAATTTP